MLLSSAHERPSPWQTRPPVSYCSCLRSLKQAIVNSLHSSIPTARLPDLLRPGQQTRCQLPRRRAQEQRHLQQLPVSGVQCSLNRVRQRDPLTRWVALFIRNQLATADMSRHPLYAALFIRAARGSGRIIHVQGPHDLLQHPFLEWLSVITDPVTRFRDCASPILKTSDHEIPREPQN